MEQAGLAHFSTIAISDSGRATNRLDSKAWRSQGQSLFLITREKGIAPAPLADPSNLDRITAATLWSYGFTA